MSLEEQGLLSLEKQGWFICSPASPLNHPWHTLHLPDSVRFLSFLYLTKII